MANAGVTKRRLQLLEDQLRRESPVLASVLASFRTLDRVGHRTALLRPDDSYAGRLSWWPMVAVLGTYSAGKSSFINWFLEEPVQRTGNQAVDDKFTVISYSRDGRVQTLPGSALNTDSRFPFFQISDEIDRVSPGEGARIDAYLQLKTCNSERLKGKILIDSPGFDADAQRTSTLKITDRIIDLSDLVLVFFDARHPEPGAMRDTLDLLVARTVARPDSNKFLFVLNQLDTTAREDNPEEVVGAWHRALSEKGLTAGRFYAIYNPDVAVPIEDEARRRRYEEKRARDVDEILERIASVGVSRSYRIVTDLEQTARTLHDRADAVDVAVRRWRQRVLWTDGIVFPIVLLAFGIASWDRGWWDGWRFAPPWGGEGSGGVVVALVVAIPLFAALHFLFRAMAANAIGDRLEEPVRGAFLHNTRAVRSAFFGGASGWGRRSRAAVRGVLEETSGFTEALNNAFTREGAAPPRDATDASSA